MKAARKIAALIVVFLLVASCSVSKQEPLLTKLEESGYAHLTSSAAITLFLTELSNRNPTAEETKLPFCGDIFKDFVRSDLQEKEIVRVLVRRKVTEETGIGNGGRIIFCFPSSQYYHP